MPRRSLSAALVAVAALVGLLAAGWWLQPRLGREPPVAPSSSRQPAPAVTTGPAPVTTSRPPASPGITRIVDTALVDDIAVSRGAVWVAAGGLVLRVDPVARRKVVVAGNEATEPPVVRLTVGAGAIWAATTSARHLLRIDPRSARVTASLSVPAEAVAADAGGVWVVCCGARGGQLTRVDPVSNRVVAAIRLPGFPFAVGVGPSGVWVLDATGFVWRVDPASNRVVATIRLPSSTVDKGEPGGAVAVTGDGVWVSDPGAATVWRIDPRRNQVTGDRWEADGSDLAVTADGVVWATSDVRLLGLGGQEVRGPRRGLHELNTDRITAVAAAPDGLWLGTPDGLFHVDRSVLRQG